jgi:hypothetical protein
MQRKRAEGNHIASRLTVINAGAVHEVALISQICGVHRHMDIFFHIFFHLHLLLQSCRAGKAKFDFECTVNILSFDGIIAFIGNNISVPVARSRSSPERYTRFPF